VNRIVLFPTCLVNEFAPETGFSVVAVLERLGFDVHVPVDLTCCGQPGFNAGFQDEARVAARHTLAVLEQTTGPIVIPSGSCGDMVIHQYAALFKDDLSWRQRAEAVAARAVEFSALVAQHLDRLSPSETRTSVAYHPSCHLLRGLGIDREPRAIISAIPGVDQRPLTADDECCGFGGLFSVKHSEISERIRDRKLNHVGACGAERLVSCDMGCLLHLERGLEQRGVQVRVQHLADLVAEALR
jgi:L-lactate dehydrogenase complex protein LldE